MTIAMVALIIVIKNINKGVLICKKVEKCQFSLFITDHFTQLMPCVMYKIIFCVN